MKRSLFSELKRRNVYRPAMLYIGGVWALAQGIAQLGPALGLPDSAARWFVVAAAIGFPFWIAFAWIYELTPEGLKRESDLGPDDRVPRRTARKLDLAIIGVLSVAVVLLLTDRFLVRRGGGEGSAAMPAKSIAVLPFANLSSDKQQEYFSEGISEDLIDLLTRIPQLSVTARTSSFAFQGKGLGIPEIARRLHVAHILEGSVEKVGDEVRITAQLVDAGTDTQLWSRSYDRKLTDVFAIQDSIAADVVRNLEVNLLGAPPTVRRTDPKAYALYLQAREIGHRFTAAALTQSDSLYRKALTVDPRYPPAWVGLAENAGNEGFIGVLSGQEGISRESEADRKALAIDPHYAPALAGVGWVAMYGQNDLTEAAREFERALALDPADPDVLSSAAALLANLGRLHEAMKVETFLVRRDPVNVVALHNLGFDQLRAGHPDTAIVTLRTVLNMLPKGNGVRYLLGVAFLMNGDPQSALSEMNRETSAPWRMMGLPLAYCALGRKADSRKALAAAIATYRKDWSYEIADDYAFCGDSDKAFDWLDRAVRYHDTSLGEIVGDNLFDRIHTDPRWLPFLRKLHKGPDQLAKVPFKVTLPAESQAAGERKS